MYRAFLDALPAYRNRVTKLTLSHSKNPSIDIGDEIYENVFFNEDTSAVFVLVKEETEEDKEVLTAGQTGPQGVIR